MGAINGILMGVYAVVILNKIFSKEISPNRHLNMQKLYFCPLRFFIP